MTKIIPPYRISLVPVTGRCLETLNWACPKCFRVHDDHGSATECCSTRFKANPDMLHNRSILTLLEPKGFKGCIFAVRQGVGSGVCSAIADSTGAECAGEGQTCQFYSSVDDPDADT